MNLHETLIEIFNIENVEEKISTNKLNIDTQVVFNAIISREKGDINLKLNVSVNTATKILHIIFPDKTGTRTYLAYLLNKYGLKLCPKCEEVLELDNFYKNKSKPDGLNSYCKNCLDTSAKSTSTARQAKYKASKTLRTPKWVDYYQELEILDFYNKCPKGYHVDHIIPLQGELVSGLHVLNNLQYLPAKENIAKNNRFLPG